MTSGFNPIGAGEYASSYYTRPFMAGGTDAFLRPLPQLTSVRPTTGLAPSTLPRQEVPESTTSPTDIVSKIPKDFNFSKPIFTPGSTIAQGLDDIGSFLGLSGGAAQGPTTGGAGYATGISTQFTPAAALGGFAGGVAANVLGLSGEYSDIGSTVGSTLGTAVGGPLGAVVGGFLGSTIGGAFGGPQPNPFSVTGSDYGVTPQGTFVDGGKISNKHIDEGFATNMRDIVGSFNTSIHEQTGIDLSKTLNWLETGYNVNHGPGFITFNSHHVKGHEDYNPDTTFVFDPNNPQSMETALRNYGSKLLEATGQEFNPEQVAGIVDRALVSSRQPGGQGIPSNTDIQITRKLPGGGSFDEFLTEYNKRYVENVA